jgi:methylmalonyl-CoA mutase
MPEPSIHTILNESFPKSGKDEWLRIASQELGGQNQIENLIWKIGELNFYPYYEEKDLQNAPYLKNYRIPHQQTNSWENLPKIKVAIEKDANRLAFTYLAGGANGVLFDVTGCIDFNINQLLDGITWPYCSVSFLANNETKIATKILAFADQNKYDSSKLRGSIFWSKVPDNTEIQPQTLSSLTNYHLFGITISPASPVEEISKSLEQGVRLMDALTNLGMEKEIVFRAISLSFSATENFLANIAKLKAVRMLWYQLSQAFEIPHYTPEDLYIHVTSDELDSDNFQPRGNLIKNTTDALSAVLGGCDGLTLCAEEDDSEMTNRIAVNVSNILKEEAHLDKVTHAVAGAYAIETMVNELAQEAWKVFQHNIRS